jgi:hypothetical protein
MGPESPFARTVEHEREAAEARPSERTAVPIRSLDKPSYGETDLDIPSFLRRSKG